MRQFSLGLFILFLYWYFGRRFLVDKRGEKDTGPDLFVDRAPRLRENHPRAPIG